MSFIISCLKVFHHSQSRREVFGFYFNPFSQCGSVRIIYRRPHHQKTRHCSVAHEGNEMHHVRSKIFLTSILLSFFFLRGGALLTRNMQMCDGSIMKLDQKVKSQKTKSQKSKVNDTGDGASMRGDVCDASDKRPKPADNWDTMTRNQKKHWGQRHWK